MNIITIPLRCLRQKWGRSAALLSVFLLGVAAITALNNVSSSVAEGFEKKLTIRNYFLCTQTFSVLLMLCMHLFDFNPYPIFL